MTSSHEATPVNVLKGAAGVFAIRATAAAIGYGMFFIIARQASAHAFGLFGFGLSLANVLALLIAVGQPTAILRLWPQMRVSGDESLARAALLLGSLSVLVACLVVIAVTAVTDQLLPEAIFPDYQGIFVPVSLLASLLAISQFMSSALRAQERTWFALIPREIVWRAVAIMSVWIGSSWFGGSWQGRHLIWLLTACLVTVLVPQLASLASQLRQSVKALPASFDFRGWRALSTRLWQISVLEVFSVELGVLLIGILAMPKAVAAFFLADRIAALLGYAVLAANIYVAPLLSRLHYGDDPAALQSVCRTASVIAFVPSLIGFLALLLFGKSMLGFIDPVYEEAWPVLLTLALGQFLNSAFGTTGSLMQMTGFEEKYRTLLWLNLLAVLVAAPLLFQLWGAVGVAIGVAAPRILRHLGAWLYIRKQLQIDPTILSVFRRRTGK